MKILIDLGHPAHIHYFKNFIRIMSSKGHHFAFVARDKEVLHELLKHYGFEYTSRGKGKKKMLGKLFYILYADFVIFKVAKRFKPDLFLSFASTYAAHVSSLFRKPHIVIDDTEHARFELMMYTPFSDVILNPSCFYKTFSKKQLYFSSYMELFYLHTKYFKPDTNIILSYGIDPGKPYFIIRFVSWGASHDIGQHGLSIKNKFRLIDTLVKYGRVLITSENELPKDLERYRLHINPIHMHHILAGASLLYGESATMASESAMLGIPSIYIDDVGRGYTTEQESKYGLVYNFTSSTEDQERSIQKCVEILKVKPETYQEKRSIMLSEKIDGTAFLVWFVENYPESKPIMKKNPDYQYKFK